MSIVAGVDFGTLSVRVTLVDSARGPIGTAAGRVLAACTQPLVARSSLPDPSVSCGLFALLGAALVAACALQNLVATLALLGGGDFFSEAVRPHSVLTLIAGALTLAASAAILRARSGAGRARTRRPPSRGRPPPTCSLVLHCHTKS